MYNRRRLIFVVVCISAVLACSEERPLYPVPPLEPLVHEPWDDREAEDIACLISGELCAPRDLYEKVVEDLILIRRRYGDSMPRLRSTVAYAPYYQPLFGILVDSGTLVRISENRHREWDSLNALYHATYRISGKYIYVSTNLRLNIWRVFESYEKIRGVQYIWPEMWAFDGPRLYAHLEERDVRYLLRDAWGDCYVGCAVSDYHYFDVRNDTAIYWGHWLDGWPETTPPDWWAAAKEAVTLWTKGDARYRFRDAAAPSRVSDLRAKSSQLGSTLTVEFTAPADSGLSEHPSTYVFRWSPDSVTSSNWYQLPHQDFAALPHGTHVTLELNRLPVRGISIIGMRAVDRLGNVGDISNTVIAENALTKGWTVYDQTNSPLPANEITSLFIDSRDRVWIGTKAGIAQLDHGQWQVFTDVDHPLLSLPATCLTESTGGTIWVGTTAGAVSYDGSLWTTCWPLDNAPTSPEIRALQAGIDGSMWMGIGFMGAVNLKDSTWVSFDASNSGVRGTLVRQIHKAPDGALWFAANNGLSSYDGESWTSYGPIRTIMSIASGPDGSIWFGTYDGLLYRLAGTQLDWITLRGEEGATRYAPTVQSVVRSDSGEVWATTYGSVRRYEQGDLWMSSVVSPSNSGLPERDITALVSGPGNILWIGTRHAGLCRWDLNVQGSAPASRATSDDHSSPPQK